MYTGNIDADESLTVKGVGVLVNLSAQKKTFPNLILTLRANLNKIFGKFIQNVI